MYTVYTCMLLTLTSRYGPASESRENRLIVVLTVKNRTSLNRKAGFTHCSQVSGYTRACVFVPSTNNLGTFGTRWERTFTSEFYEKRSGNSACLCTNKRHLRDNVFESSWGRKVKRKLSFSKGWDILEWISSHCIPYVCMYVCTMITF